MTDMSHLDSQYFVDNAIYNCPFCKRNHVAYSGRLGTHFDWTNEKRCYIYVVQCHSCAKRSMHLTFEEQSTVALSPQAFRFAATEGLDDKFFYSVPTSFFALDSRIPEVMRTLITEAEGCLKSNHLTGASACARKIVYELAKHAEAVGENYEDRVKSLKTIYPNVDGSFFDTLLTVQSVTSTKVHENALDGWSAKHLRVILAAIREVLHEIFVVPALRQDRRRAVLALKDELMPKQRAAEAPQVAPQATNAATRLAGPAAPTVIKLPEPPAGASAWDDS